MLQEEIGQLKNAQIELEMDHAAQVAANAAEQQQLEHDIEQLMAAKATLSGRVSELMGQGSQLQIRLMKVSNAVNSGNMTHKSYTTQYEAMHTCPALSAGAAALQTLGVDTWHRDFVRSRYCMWCRHLYMLV